MRKLKALLAAVGLATIGGVAFLVVVPKEGVTRADLLDAGITEHCDPVVVTCAGRDLCRNVRADGGLSPRYRTIRALAYRCDRPGEQEPALILRTTQPECFEPLGGDTCEVVGATVDDGGTGVQAEPDRCACRQRGQMCRYPNPDGGLGIPMNLDQTYPPPFSQHVGAGCVRKACVEAAGEQGMSMPEECK